MSTTTDDAKKAAYDAVVKALNEYTALCPPPSKPDGPPNIRPRRMWADPDSFRLGYGMYLECSVAPSLGKVPVLVVPLRYKDISSYTRKMRGYQDARAKLAAIGIEPC